MELYGTTSRSVPQKITIQVIEVVILWLSYWILFQGGGAWFEKHLHIHNATGSIDRRIVIFTFNIIIFVRIGYMMIVLLKRKIPWAESISVPFAFALYFVGYPLLVLPVSAPLDALDYFAVGVFITGCVLNSVGEILRSEWKKKPENKGQIYTGGLFKYSRHINYFGDILWVSAYALVTRNWYSIGIPVFLFCFFAFYNAPKLDKYLKCKYGAGYDAYAKRTRMLIPYLY